MLKHFCLFYEKYAHFEFDAMVQNVETKDWKSDAKKVVEITFWAQNFCL